MGFGEKHFVDDLDLVAKELREHGEATIQFDRPIGDKLYILAPEEAGEPEDGTEVSAKEYVARVKSMLVTWGEALTLRFYAHYSDVFDGRSVLDFPEVQSLDLGNFDDVIHLEAVSELPDLKRLSFRFYDLKDKTTLGRLPLDRLTHLVIGSTATKALDLTPLVDAQGLKRLYLDGHHKNIAELSALGKLEEFTFAPKKGLNLDFINGMRSLRALKFVLGGTEAITDISLPELQDLAFTETRGLAELGDMQRFPKLRRLLMQDQQQFGRISFGKGNAKLEHLRFYNCQKLATVDGLAECDRLKSMSWLFTDVDPATVQLPMSLTHLHMLSGRRGMNDKEEAAIADMGYIADEHPDMFFFYK